MSSKTLELSDKEGVAELVRACYHFGMRHVVISPGSRNAPITLSLVRSGLFECHSIADERAAGFYALGLAAASGTPVAAVCTSGSATANLAPAMSEAFYARIPLIAITADRPSEWTDQGNGQTIRQEGIFRNFCKMGFNLHAEPTHADEEWFNRRKLSQLFNTALHADKGPAHINVPLREPLYGVKTYEWQGKNPYYHTTTPDYQLSSADAKRFRDTFANTRRVMILVGQSPVESELSDVLQLALKAENVIVLTETGSNVELEHQVDTIDRLLMSIDGLELNESLKPELLISVGAFLVSKKVKAWLRDAPIKAHWRVHPYDSGIDTYQNLTEEIRMRPFDFFTEVLADSNAPSTYKNDWRSLYQIAADAHNNYTAGLPYSDFSAFRDLLPALKPGSVLHSANSSPIRYIQLFGRMNGLEYQVNRGTSGIDGSTSTAAGWARAQPAAQHVLITGDVAFLYDSNALWNDAFPENLKIVVINNGGGGIFRIIDGSNEIPELDRFFETHHKVDLNALCQAFSFPFLRVTNQKELADLLPTFFAKQGKAILEIQTPRKSNAGVLKAYFKSIRKAIEENQNS